MATRNLREVGDRVEELLTELRGAADPALTDRAEELVRLLVELYGAGLERVMEIVAEGSPTLVDRIADDQLLASLLVLHGLHPVPVETRIHQALDNAQKYAGPIRYLGIDDDGVAHLKLEQAPQGCSSTAMTVKDAIEKAVSDAAPELGGVELVGLFVPPPPPSGNGTPITLGAAKGGNAVPVTIGRAPR
jgi:Fe-S cluster biogenesis protein NfuA